MRLPVADFNIDDTGGGTHDYNESNCKDAARLYNASTQNNDAQGVINEFWCEEGSPQKAGMQEPE